MKKMSEVGAGRVAGVGADESIEALLKCAVRDGETEADMLRRVIGREAARLAAEREAAAWRCRFTDCPKGVPANEVFTIRLRLDPIQRLRLGYWMRKNGDKGAAERLLAQRLMGWSVLTGVGRDSGLDAEDTERVNCAFLATEWGTGGDGEAVMTRYPSFIAAPSVA